MKTFARLIRRYVLATAGIILVVVALLLGMTIYAGVRYNDASDSVQKVGALAEALHPTADGLQWDAAHTPVSYTHLLDVGAIEYIHKQIVAERDKGKAVLLVSLELDEVMNLSDRILVMYEGEIVGEFDPKTTTVEELGLYMAGAKKQGEAKA